MDIICWGRGGRIAYCLPACFRLFKVGSCACQNCILEIFNTINIYISVKCFPGTQRSANFEAAVRYAIRLVQKKLQSRNHLALALEYFDLQTKDHDCWAISKWSQYFSNNTRPRFPAAADKIVDHQGSDKVKKNVTSWKAFLYCWDIILG